MPASAHGMCRSRHAGFPSRLGAAHPKGGHAAFVYAQTSTGAPILLGGNQSDAINFGMQKASELKGFFVPGSYLKFAQDRLAKGIELEKSTPKDLNNEFHITFAQKKKNADR
ncbi:hypothetical protein [Burkholderia stabilis]|nr:hypothetical protein [Burkholderia stabilis]